MRIDNWCMCGCVLAGLIFLNIFTVSYCEDEEEEIPRDCFGYIQGFAIGILNSTLRCISGQSTFHMNNILELGTRASCLLKCTLQGQGIISMEGALDDIGAAFYFEETFAEEVREIALPEAQACFSLGGDFQPKEYWCKSYLPFIECSLRAIIKGMIPYVGGCVSTPIIGILFSVIKYISPEAPKLAEEVEEMRRIAKKRNRVKCMDKNCTKLWEYKKVNGSNAIVLYNKDMEVLSVETRPNRPKSRNTNIYKIGNNVEFNL